MPAWVQALAAAPAQIWAGLRNPSATIVSLMLSLVTATGFNSTDATSFWPLLTLSAADPDGFLPLTRSTASCAAPSASGLIALYTVMYCSPVSSRCTAANSASCPVTGGIGLMPWPFIAAIAPPAVPSLAAYTPTNPVLPTAVIACSISVWALSGDQSGVSYSLATLNPDESITLCAPCLNSLALLSVGAPLIITIDPDFPSPL